MCMTLAVSAPGVVLVATDTRFTWGTDTDEPRVRDLGTKLRRIPQGWAAGTGNTAILLAGLRVLEMAGGGCVTQTRSALQRVGRSVRTQAEGGEKAQETMWMIGRADGGVFSIHSARENGDDLDPDDSRSGRFARLVAWPAGVLSGSKEEAEAGLNSRLQGVRSLWDLLRVVGWAFDFASDRCDTMSPEVELGFTNAQGAAYLRAPAAWIASATDGELRAALKAPPQLEPFPMLPAERRVFRRLAAA
jgi:hypothetical protein